MNGPYDSRRSSIHFAGSGSMAATGAGPFSEFCQPQLFRDERISNTPGVPPHHQLMRDPTVQFSRNRPRHG